MKQFLLKSEIKTENDIVWVRKKSRELSQFLNLDKQEQTRLATAVSEIARNTFQYASKGTVEFNLDVIHEKVWIVIQVKDKGPGIKDLKSVLAGTYVSPGGMGVGLSGSRKLVDDLQIESGPDGTTITLVKLVPLRASVLSQLELKKMLDTFVSQTTSDPIEEIQKQNQEILLTIGALNEKKEELSRLNKELEDTNRGVVALYAELDEKAESLRIANETKTSFLSDMTHEFRSPLNSIISISDFLLEEAREEGNKEREKQVQFIAKAAQGLSDLVNDLLDIAKIEAGKIPVRPEKFLINDLFSSLRGLMRPLSLKNPDVQLVIEDTSTDLKVFTDEGKVGQMLRNLISNAIKYTERGEITVSASFTDSSTVEFRVKDTGIGISAKNLELIFSEFVQIDNPLQKQTKGTGLGLPLTKKLATLLGGSISVESAQSKGSIFTISIPAVYTGPSDADYGVMAAKPVIKMNLKKVLIIDDDENHRLLLKKMMNKKHLSVREAQNGLEGIEIGRSWRPDLIILDLFMPKMNGFEFIRAALMDESLRPIPIVLNTSKELSPEELQYLDQVTYKVFQKNKTNLKNIEQIIQDLLED